MIICFSGPSGTGKSTLANYLLKNFPDEFSVFPNLTTRRSKDSDTPGEYLHISKEEFFLRKKNGEFVFTINPFKGIWYGATKTNVENCLKRKGNAIAFFAPMNALKIKKIYKDQVLLLYFIPPSEDELKRRLRNRGESDENISERLTFWRDCNAKYQNNSKFYQIINMSTEEMAQEIMNIISETRI